MKKSYLLMAIVTCLAVSAIADLISDIAAADRAADRAVSALRTADELSCCQSRLRESWLRNLGGLPEKTPLNAKEGPVVGCDGFTLQNVLFESQPGVYVVGHLALPSSPAARRPYPAVLMPLGHSDNGILAPRYAAQMADMARAGFAAFAWDPLSQGERRQCEARHDTTQNCSVEHTSLGARGWLVGWNFARFRIWDGIRALDYLETRKDVDCTRVGVCGTSGGGTMSAYLQALDPRIKVAFPNCYVSSLRAVTAERGCHDAEQFCWRQLTDGLNHAAILALGQPRVALATGSRWQDYFPHAGAVETFGVLTNMATRLGLRGPFWHFHCAGQHGLSAPTRAAQLDWMKHAILGQEAVKPLAAYSALTKGDHDGANDPALAAPLPFPKEAAFFTSTHQVRDLPGFKSVYALIADRARDLAAKRTAKTREQLREIVRRRAGIRPLDALRRLTSDDAAFAPYDHAFGWWYLNGAYGCRRENEAAMRAMLGQSVVGRQAEALILKAAQTMETNGHERVTLAAKGWDCIAAAHAVAAEPELFASVRFEDPPPSWTALATAKGPACDSFAIGVWGALEEYDWTDLVPQHPQPGQGIDKLYDGRLDPTCAWEWHGRPIEIETDFGEERDVGGVRFWAGRSWISRGVRKASFLADGKPIAEHVEFRPAHTYKDSFATWPSVRCRRVKMVVEDIWERDYGYYMWYMHLATPHMPYLFDSPPYTLADRRNPHLEIAELRYFGATPPDDLPKPNANGSLAYPESRLVRDWMYQSCAVSNVSHCANVEPDTTKPDPLGQSIDGLPFGGLPRTDDPTYLAWLAKRKAQRRAFLKDFRERAPDFIYVKHLVMGNSIMHATDDMTDASFLEWKTIPDYFTGSQLIRAHINEDGSVSQEVLVDEPKGIIRDPCLDFDAKYVVFAKRSSMEGDNYHLWKLDLATHALTQLTFEPTMPQRLVPGQTNDFTLVCSDIEPCVLVDGSIVFQSTRVCHSVDCWPLPVSNLYRCDADGANIRRIGFDQIQTFNPQMLEDGRIAYTRWEYQDRSASGLQQLYAMKPDGTRQMGLFANNSEWPFSLMHCRGVPGTEKLVAILCGHHVAQKGKIVELDPSEGDDFSHQTYDPAKSLYGMNTNDIVYTDFPGGKFVVKWTPYDNPCGPTTTNFPGMYYLAGASLDARPGRVPAKQPKDYQYNVYDMCSQFGPQWAYPHALDDGHYLVSFMPEGCRYFRGPYSSRFGVYATDKTGRRELLAFDWGNHCMQPIAIRPRGSGARRAVKKLDYTKGFGTYYVHDVYQGAAAEGLERGSVKKLRVVALEYRPVHNGWNWQYGWHSSQGKIGTPIAVGNGAYDVKHVLGEADVEPDGSCMFRCPVRTPVYFQLVDKDGLVLQTMRSWTTLMPDEANSCTGCHEHPNDAAPVRQMMAARKPPQDLQSAIPGMPRHPLLERLEKEGPIASLENWMGVNRPMRATPDEILARGIPAEERGDGIGFVKDIQPIFDRLQAQCPGEKILGLDLTDTPAQLPATDDKSMRTYSKAYLAFTEKGKGTDNVNFPHGLSFAPFKPPKSFGAICSKWYLALASGWPDKNGKPRIKMSDADRRMLALWIDLGIPYCSAYTERHTWDAWHQHRYLYTYDKRIFSYWIELDEIRRDLGLPSVPLTGFVPNVAEPRKQRYWHE